MLRAPTLDLISNNLIDVAAVGGSQKPGPDQKKPRAKKPNPDVLFDADDFDGDDEGQVDDDDDFGTFESGTLQPADPCDDLSKLVLDAEAVTKQGQNPPPAQLLSTPGWQDWYPQPPRSPSFRERNPFPGLGLTTPRAADFPVQAQSKSSLPVTAWPCGDTVTTDQAKGSAVADDWAEFELASANEIKSSLSAPGWDWKEWDDVEVPASTAVSTREKQGRDTGGPPPTNIPPPSILLSIFPDLINSVDDALFQPIRGHEAALKGKILSDAATVTFLRGYLALATVAARIVTGRKLRWHRDKFLAQGMSISAAGSKGGMKLAGIDKAQSIREDREVADVVAAFRDKVGRLRGAVAAANAAVTDGSRPLRLPEIGEAVSVQTVQKAASAPNPCVVCGLKREERVPKVDFDVEDSFGEWWVDFWGHRACKNFWLEHEARLRQR